MVSSRRTVLQAAGTALGTAALLGLPATARPDATFETGDLVQPTTALSVRDGANTRDRRLATVESADRGVVLDVEVGTDYTWYFVDWGTRATGIVPLRGWSAAPWLTIDEPLFPEGAYVYATAERVAGRDTVPVYPGTARQQTPLFELDAGERVYVLTDPFYNEDGVWQQVHARDSTGYALSLTLTRAGDRQETRYRAGDQVQPTANLSVREGPGTDLRRVAVVDPADRGTVVAVEPGAAYTWYLVRWTTRTDERGPQYGYSAEPWLARS
jgi:hypothetical protein